MRTTERQLRQGEPTIEDMRWAIAEHEAMNMGTKLLIEILYHGTEGLSNMDYLEIRDELEMLFGDSV